MSAPEGGPFSDEILGLLCQSRWCRHRRQRADDGAALILVVAGVMEDPTSPSGFVADARLSGTYPRRDIPALLRSIANSFERDYRAGLS